MFSVTSEAAANAAFQAAPQWSARSDQPPANDLFGALVNNNTPADTVTTPPPPPPQRRTDDAPPPADNAGAGERSVQSGGKQRSEQQRQRRTALRRQCQQRQLRRPTRHCGNPAIPDEVRAGPRKPTPRSRRTSRPMKIRPRWIRPSWRSRPLSPRRRRPRSPLQFRSPPQRRMSLRLLASPRRWRSPRLQSQPATQAISAQAASSAQIKTDFGHGRHRRGSSDDNDNCGPRRDRDRKDRDFSGGRRSGRRTRDPASDAAHATPANAAALTSAVAATAPVTPKTAPGKSSAATTATDGSTTLGYGRSVRNQCTGGGCSKRPACSNPRPPASRRARIRASKRQPRTAAAPSTSATNGP